MKAESTAITQTQEGKTEPFQPQNFDDPFIDSTGMI